MAALAPTIPLGAYLAHARAVAPNEAAIVARLARAVAAPGDFLDRMFGI